MESVLIFLGLSVVSHRLRSAMYETLSKLKRPVGKTANYKIL